MFYALNGKMLSIMPLGSYVFLSLEPGRHTFSRFAVVDGGLFPLRINRLDVQLDLVAGQTYYVGPQNALFSISFGLADHKQGSEIVAESELAKLIHQPVSAEVFVSRLEESERKRKAGTAPQSVTQSSPPSNVFSATNALPSSKQVGEFLEVLATVALVAVFLFAAAAGATANSDLAPTPSLNLALPPAISTPALARPPALATTWRSSSGTLSEILNSKDQTILHNTSTGARYRIEDGRITGSDGSRYRVTGSTVYSESGQTYRVVGNSIFASDGRSCVKTGIVVSCQ
jgi:hypothetical protein